ncbi:RcnB family protein [Novosphingobium sp. PS1R-30]|uniref:RcnB family protein n=1 Tax=Novosphingobium anseongense TaxID=3133436 RepID=A0ABU8RTS7_9SPHN
MAVGKFMKSSGIAALVAGLAVLAVPAQAQERGGWGGRGGGNATAQQNNGGNGGTPSWRGNGGGSEGGGWRGGGGNRGFRSEQSTGATAAPAPIEARPQRNWSRGDTNGGVTGGSTRWQGRGNGANTDGGNRWNGSRNRPADQAQAAPVQQQPGQVEAQRRAWNGNGTNQWQGRDRDRNRDRAASNQNWRNDNNSNWRGNDAWRGSGRETWRNNDRQSLSRNWNRDWRRDNRYDWRGYRSSNRDIYRLGAYASPYRNYSYRRLNSGFYLDTLFFGSRYWINDPWQYRLPPAYGPYRWIRYYDDAMLVDTYSGEVVDVIYDFFW